MGRAGAAGARGDSVIKVAAIVLTLLIALLVPSQQGAPACVVSSSDVAASLVTAQADPSHCLDIPAGVYSVGAATNGAWLNATADNLEIKGAGEGKTILSITQPLTLTADLAVIRLFGVGQRVHDLTLNLGTGHSGSGSLGGISVYGSGGIGSFVGRAERAQIDHIEITGGYSANGSGGYGIGTFRGWDYQGGAQWNTIDDNWIHDTPATGIGVNSSYNIIAHNRLERVGASTLAHGFYAQGGYNLYDGNYVANASGYSFHGYKHVPNLDSSGDRFVNNTSIDPGQGHLIVDSINGATGPLNRSAVVSGNVFRNTGAHASIGLTIAAPAIVSDNTFEDVAQSGQSAISVTGANGSIIEGNRITSATLGSYAIYVGNASTAQDNAIEGSGYLVGININGAAIIRGNRITMGRAGATGITVSSANARIEDNDVTMISGVCVGFTSSWAGVIVRDNVLAGAKWIVMPDTTQAILDRNILR